jgi:uncharacterized protein RhaS with RHS repeats
MSGLSGRFLTRDPIEFEGSPWSLYQYVRSNPHYWVDPEGLAELDADPTSSNGVQWCYHNFAARPRMFIHGDTELWHYYVDCRCVCCSDGFCHGTAKKTPMCTVVVRLSIRINPKTTWRKEDVYGHEQHHVDNFLRAAARAQKLLTEREKAAGCKEEKECAKLADAMANEGQDILSQAVFDEAGHKSPTPRDGTKYPPKHPMPREPQPQCKSPSDPKPFAEPECIYMPNKKPKN